MKAAHFCYCPAWHPVAEPWTLGHWCSSVAAVERPEQWLQNDEVFGADYALIAFIHKIPYVMFAARCRRQKWRAIPAHELTDIDTLLSLAKSSTRSLSPRK